MPNHSGLLVSELAFGEAFAPVRDDTTFEDVLEQMLGTHNEVGPFSQDTEQHLIAQSPGRPMWAAVHAVPDNYDAGEITEDVFLDIVLWNGTDDETAVLQTVNEINTAGLVWTPPTPPLTIGPETSFVYPMTIDADGVGPGDYLATIQFIFNNGVISTVNISWSIPVPPEIIVAKQMIILDQGAFKPKELVPGDFSAGTRSAFEIQAADDAEFEGLLGRAPVAGERYYNTTDNVFRYWNGTTYVNI